MIQNRKNSDYWQRIIGLKVANLSDFQSKSHKNWTIEYRTINIIKPIKKATCDFSHSGFLMEAAGIEPASRDISVTASTCVDGSFPHFAQVAPTAGVFPKLARNFFNRRDIRR